MKTKEVSKELLLTDDLIWRTPHLLQKLRRDPVDLDDYIRLLVEDMAFGATDEGWFLKLLNEGNVGLASELARHIGLHTNNYSEYPTQKKIWQELVSVARVELDDFIEDQRDELNEDDLEDYETQLEIVESFYNEEAYLDALSVTEQTHKMLNAAIRRRQKELLQSFEIANQQITRARKKVIVLGPNKFPGGPDAHRKASRLLIEADNQLLTRNFGPAMQIAEWVKDLCDGEMVSNELIEEILRKAETYETAYFEELLEKEIEDQEDTEELVFEGEWTLEDDQYLIENYEIMTNGQLNHYFHIPEKEIEKRIRYHGLMHDRENRRKNKWPNPYIVGSPIRNKRMFVGRDDVFEFIQETLGERGPDEDRNLLALIGHRRTGKTSILLQLTKNRRDVIEPRIPVFIDVDGLLPFKRPALQNFYYKLSKKIFDTIQNEGYVIPEPHEKDFEDPAWKFNEFIEKVQLVIEDHGLLLMFDEFQSLEPRFNLIDVDVYKFLRSTIQHNPGLDFIISGTLLLQDMMKEYRMALFGAAIHKRIDILEERDAVRLIREPVKNYITYTKPAIEKIIDFTACHPYVVQQVCHILIRYLSDRAKSVVYENDVDHIVPNIVEQDFHFGEIWGTDTSELEQYVMAVAGELSAGIGNWMPTKDIREHMQVESIPVSSPIAFDNAVNGLITKNILMFSQDGKNVRFQVPVFGHWVTRRKPVELVRKEIQAEARKEQKRIEKEPKYR